MKNQVQLIAYVDRCGGGTFSDLQQLLDGPLQGAFGGVPSAVSIKPER
jgi:sucrose phosphorylase